MITFPKLSLELKQTAKGFWYVGSFKVNAESSVELDSLFLQGSVVMKRRVLELNSEGTSEGKNLQGIKEQPKEEIILSPDEDKLFQNLKALRLILSKQEGMPPYVIFHDSILKRVTRERPLDKEGLIKIIGEKKFSKYGDLIFELLEKHKTI